MAASSSMHYEAQRRFGRSHRFVGALATILTAIVGAAAIKEIGSSSDDPTVRWVIGVLGALAGVVTAVHTFLGHATRAANHKSTAAGYASIRRRIDEALVFGHQSPQEAKATSKSLRDTMDSLSRDAPEVPPDILAKYRKPSLGTYQQAGARDGEKRLEVPSPTASHMNAR